MKSEIDILVHALFLEKEKAAKAAEEAKQSKISWVFFSLLMSFFVGAWFAGNHAEKYYNLGVEAGILSTQEGRSMRAAQSLLNYKCDERGGNCVNIVLKN